MKTKILVSALLSFALANGAFALGTTSISTPGYYGNINNGTGFVIECSQVLGGYCANNPMPADGYIQMLPDPGSHAINGHVMVYDQANPGTYVDNLIFNYAENKKGKWHFQMQSLYKKISIQIVNSNTILLQKTAS